MGCCHQTEKVQSTVIRPKIDLDRLSISEALSIIKESVLESLSFHEAYLSNRINKSKPLSQPDLDRHFKISSLQALSCFEGKYKGIPSNPDLCKKFKIFKSYLLSKCESREGYYRYLNDLYSNEYVFDLLSKCLNLFCSGEVSKEEARNRYQRYAKGTFMIYGLERLDELLENEDNFTEKLEELKKEKIGELSENKKQLENLISNVENKNLNEEQVSIEKLIEQRGNNLLQEE